MHCITDNQNGAPVYRSLCVFADMRGHPAMGGCIATSMCRVEPTRGEKRESVLLNHRWTTYLIWLGKLSNISSCETRLGMFCSYKMNSSIWRKVFTKRKQHRGFAILMRKTQSTLMESPGSGGHSAQLLATHNLAYRYDSSRCYPDTRLEGWSRCSNYVVFSSHNSIKLLVAIIAYQVGTVMSETRELIEEAVEKDDRVFWTLRDAVDGELVMQTLSRLYYLNVTSGRRSCPNPSSWMVLMSVSTQKSTPTFWWDFQTLFSTQQSTSYSLRKRNTSRQKFQPTCNVA